MTDVQQSTMRATAVAYEPPYVGDALMARLSHDDVPAGLPLLDVERVPDWRDPSTLDRSALVAALRQSYEGLGVEPPNGMLRELEEGAWLVVTGQQPGLFTGPGYALFKALTAVQMARRLSEAWGRPVLPAFWIASEDHDLLEVNHAWLGGRRIDMPRDELGKPVGRISLEQDREKLLAFCREHLAGLPWADRAMAIIESTSLASYTTQFAQMLTAMLGEQQVLLLDPMQLRGALAPALSGVVERCDGFAGAFDRGTRALVEADVPPQLDDVSLFEFRDGQRVRCAITPEVSEHILAEPERFSPGAALRPIVQDAALPVVCTVGGPAEMRYLWQIDALYQAADVKRSRLWPRISVTTIDAQVMRKASRLGLGHADLMRLPGVIKAFDALSRLEGHETRTLFDAVETQTTQLLDVMKRLNADGNDDVIGQAKQGVRAQVRKAMQHAAHQQLAKMGIGKEQYVEACEQVFPGGTLAERRTCGLEYFARYGKELVDYIADHVDAMTIAHHLIETGHEQGEQRGG